MVLRYSIILLLICEDEQSRRSANSDNNMIRSISNLITLEPLIFLLTFGMQVLNGGQIQTNFDHSCSSL